MTTYQTQTYRLRQLFSTLAVATASNLVLLEGEKWQEKDAITGLFTGRTKTGKDGVVTGTAPNQTITGTAFNDLPFDPGGSSGSGTVTSVTGTAPIYVATGTTTPVISISEATPSTAGSMSATDKTKLNGLAAVAVSGSYADLSNRPTLFDPASPGAIGGTAAAAGSFTALSASNSLLLPSGAPPTPARGHLYPAENRLLYRDSANAEQTLLYGGGNLANLADKVAARANLDASPSLVKWSVGNYVCPVNTSVGTGAATAANLIYLAMFISPVSFSFTELGARINTAVAGSNYQLAIYASNSSLRPTGLPIASTASISGAAAAAVAIGASGTCIAGQLYWFAANQDNAGMTYQAPVISSTLQGFTIGSPSLGTLTSANSQASFYRQFAATFGNWPDLTSATTTELAAAQRCPLIYMKVGALL
jgi:hypothetical protein